MPTAPRERFGLTCVGRALSVGLALSPALAGAQGADALWTQWGGPDRNFRVAAAPLSPEWPAPHVTAFSMNACTPVWGPDGVLFVSSGYGVGSRGLRLRLANGRTEVEQLCFNSKVHVMHGSAVRVGDVIWASSGDLGPAFLVGVRARSGEEVARLRGFAKANLVASGERLVLLDEEGVLGLVSIEGERPVVLAQAPLLSARAWVVPTLVGTTLYARDRKEIVAVDLGR